MTDATVPLDALRDGADRVTREADAIAETHWPAIESDALCGSAVGGVATADRVSGPVSGVVADLHAWAAATRSAVRSLDTAEQRFTQAIGVP